MCQVGLLTHCGFSGVSPDGNCAYVHWGSFTSNSRSVRWAIWFTWFSEPHKCIQHLEALWRTFLIPQAVTHPIMNWARRCLTSVIEPTSMSWRRIPYNDHVINLLNVVQTMYVQTMYFPDHIKQVISPYNLLERAISRSTSNWPRWYRPNIAIITSQNDIIYRCICLFLSISFILVSLCSLCKSWRWKTQRHKQTEHAVWSDEWLHYIGSRRWNGQVFCFWQNPICSTNVHIVNNGQRRYIKAGWYFTETEWMLHILQRCLQWRVQTCVLRYQISDQITDRTDVPTSLSWVEFKKCQLW